MRPTTVRTTVLLVALSLVAVACGQKPGVHVETRGRTADDGFAAGDPGFADGELDDDWDGEAGDPGDPGADPSGGGGPAGGPGGGGGAGPGGGPGGGGSGGGGEGAGGAGQPAGEAWGDTILIGIHAPITGAAPLPASFAQAAQVFPNWINQRGGIHGRQIRVEVVNDEYQPSTASRRCTELVQRNNAFLLVGGGGADQIQACARTAEGLGVPYLSSGVTERGMRALRGYFALSMSYPQQGPYLANLIRQRFADRAGNAAIVHLDTPNFADAVQAFTGAIDARAYRLSRVPSSTELANVARQLCVDGVRVAYPLMAPTNWLTMLRAVTCDIQWVGAGLTMGLNTVASTGCRTSGQQIDGSIFFSPFPGVDQAGQLDPEFAEAARAAGWNGTDDIYVALWASTKAIAALLEAAGEHLTRPGFVQSTERVQGLRTGMNPTLSYSPDNHFGASEVHVLQVDCSIGQYRTIDTFARF